MSELPQEAPLKPKSRLKEYVTWLLQAEDIHFPTTALGACLLSVGISVIYLLFFLTYHFFGSWWVPITFVFLFVAGAGLIIFGVYAIVRSISTGGRRSGY